MHRSLTEFNELDQAIVGLSGSEPAGDAWTDAWLDLATLMTKIECTRDAAFALERARAEALQPLLRVGDSPPAHALLQARDPDLALSLEVYERRWRATASRLVDAGRAIRRQRRWRRRLVIRRRSASLAVVGLLLGAVAVSAALTGGDDASSDRQSARSDAVPVASAPRPIASAPPTPIASAPPTPIASAPPTPIASAPPGPTARPSLGAPVAVSWQWDELRIGAVEPSAAILSAQGATIVAAPSAFDRSLRLGGDVGGSICLAVAGLGAHPSLVAVDLSTEPGSGASQLDLELFAMDGSAARITIGVAPGELAPGRAYRIAVEVDGSVAALSAVDLVSGAITERELPIARDRGAAASRGMLCLRTPAGASGAVLLNDVSLRQG